MATRQRFDGVFSGRRQALILGAIALAPLVGLLSRAPSAPGIPVQPPPAIDAPLSRIPLQFIENRGQWDVAAQFVARQGAVNAYLAADSLTYQFLQRTGTAASRIRGVNLRFAFESANSDARMAGRSELAGRLNYFHGKDPAAWYTDVRAYEGVVYEGLYDGVDLEVRNPDHQLEYDLVLARGANLARVTMHVDGASGPIRIDADGALVIDTEFGAMHQPKPTTWQHGRDGERIAVACDYRLLGDNRFGFAVPDRDPDLALTIDPGLIYSTYLGGSGVTQVASSTVDASGAVLLTGWTFSSSFITTPGAFDISINGDYDAFLMKLSPAGDALVFSTFLGAANTDNSLGVAVDAAGSATLVGSTNSATFPTTAGAFDTSSNGFTDAFVTKFTPAGNGIVYSTLLGSGAADGATAVVLDATGAAIVTGWASGSTPPAFPTTAGAYNTTAPAGSTRRAFVTKLSLNGAALVWSTWLGGFSEAYGLALGALDEVTVVGWGDAFFPTTTGAFDTSHNFSRDVFVTRLNPSGTALVYSTFLGGGGTDEAYSVALDATGAATVVGYTSSTNFPTTPGALSTTPVGFEGFVAKLSPTGAALAYSTYLGGVGDDRVLAVALDSSGAATVVGRTTSANFPVTGDALDATFNSVATGSGHDGFITRLSVSGATLAYSTFLGGNNNDEAWGVRVDSLGAAIVMGRTQSSDFPTTVGAYRTTNSILNSVAFVSKLQIAVPDTVPPAVTITSPADGAVFGTSSVTLAASIVDTSTTTVTSTPAGISASLPAGGGSVSGTVPLVEGPNILTVSATDVASNTSATSIAVYRDTVAPVVTISPAEGTIVSSPIPSFGITVTDQTVTAVTIGGTPVGSVPVDGGGVYGVASTMLTGSIALWQEGANSIVVVATDAAGNTTTVTRTVLLDSTAPLVEILTPANGACYANGTSPVIPLIAMIDDATATEVTGALVGALGAGGGTLTGTFTLQEGLNAISVTATNPGLGLAATATVTVTLDTIVPIVTITTPADGACVRGTVEFHATATDVLPGTIESTTHFVDDVALAQSALYLVDTAALVDGSHVLRVDAADSCGNVTSRSITIHVDNTAPGVVISDPIDLASVTGTIPFSASATDAGSGLVAITMTAADAPPTTDGSQTYATPVAFGSAASQVDTLAALGGLDGDLELEVTARDCAGNETTVAITVHVDNTATKAITSPADGAIVRCVIRVEASINDPNLASAHFVIGGVASPSMTAAPFQIAYDTRNRLDGDLLITLVTTNTAGTVSSCSISVTVDNLEVEIEPETLELKSKGGDRSVTAKIEGQSAHLLCGVAPQSITLCVPGGSPIPATIVHGHYAGWHCNHGHESWHRGHRKGHEHRCRGRESEVKVKFDRQLLIGALRGAGLTNGRVEMTVKVTLGGETFVIGSDTVRVRSH